MTSHENIEAAALALFTTQGFESTTTDEIAEAAGISRRTLFRYYGSKYDIPWGQFDTSLAAFAATLDAEPWDVPAWEVVQRAVVQFNSFYPDAIEQHRTRMRLILGTPSLQAHSVLMYERWRSVIADYVGRRFGQPADALLPRTAGHVSLALAISAYEQWLKTDDAPIEDLLAQSMAALVTYIAHG